jgi:hypothetical protein
LTETVTHNSANAASMSAARRLLLVAMAILALFAALCTVFAGVVTAVELWRTHVQAQWPTAAGTVDTCDITYPSTGSRRKRQYIRCRFSYSTESGPATATLTSAYFPTADVPQYPANQQQPFVDWVNDHLPGTHVALRYNPEDHRQIILANNYMPRGGPHTQDNLKLLATFAGIFVVAMVMARVLRPRDAARAS